MRQDLCEEQIGDKCDRGEAGSYGNRVAAFVCRE